MEEERKSKPSIKMPRTLGDCADTLYSQRAARLTLGAQVKQYQTNETALKDHMLDKFSKDELSSARGTEATVSIDYEYYPSLKDPKKFFMWVAKNKRWDLLYKQVNAEAWREMHTKGKTVPGVEPFRDVKFSVTKVPAAKQKRLADKKTGRRK